MQASSCTQTQHERHHTLFSNTIISLKFANLFAYSQFLLGSDKRAITTKLFSININKYQHIIYKLLS